MTTPDPFPTFCVTMDCGLRATRYVTCEGEGKHPYCDECADVLIRGGESDLGPVEQPSPDPTPTQRKHVVNVGRWRIAIMRNGPYRSGWRFWSREHFDFALPWFCVSMLRRSSRVR